jgi:hypothetical protein
MITREYERQKKLRGKARFSPSLLVVGTEEVQVVVMPRIDSRMLALVGIVARKDIFVETVQSLASPREISSKGAANCVTDESDSDKGVPEIFISKLGRFLR